MKILLVSDPVDKLHPKGDSSLVIVREALRRGWEVYWNEGRDIYFSIDRVKARCAKVVDCPAGDAPRLASFADETVREFSTVFIRKDPPFDAKYIELCWILALEEPHVRMINRPSQLVRYHEKLVPWEAVAQGFLKQEDIIPSFIEGFKAAQSQLDGEQVIVKPFLGFGGRNIEKLTKSQFQSQPERTDVFIQPFLPQIEKVGDRRVFFINGRLSGHFVRLPAKGGYVSNLAQGGSAVLGELSQAEMQVFGRLEKFLQHHEIFLAGADAIGPLISEVNITSPTGLAQLIELEGRDYSSDILDALQP